MRHSASVSGTVSKIFSKNGTCTITTCEATIAATEISNGLYKIDLAAADLNGDTVTLRFTGTGADATILTIATQPT